MRGAPDPAFLGAVSGAAPLENDAAG